MCCSINNIAVLLDHFFFINTHADPTVSDFFSHEIGIAELESEQMKGNVPAETTTCAVLLPLIVWLSGVCLFS